MTNIDHLSQANYILEQMGYQPESSWSDAQPKRADPCLTRTILAKAKEWLDAQSVGYMICRRFGVPCEAPDVSNLAAFFYDGFEPQDRRQALGQIQDMAQKIGGSIERAITPQVRSRNMNRSTR